MASKKTPTESVDALLTRLAHPKRAEIDALRRLVLSVSPSVVEEVKWNSPSFRTTEHFATMHLRSRDGIQLILHLGAKKRDAVELAIDDPTGLLEWLAPDRASVKFTSVADVKTKKAALVALLRQWIAVV